MVLLLATLAFADDSPPIVTPVAAPAPPASPAPPPAVTPVGEERVDETVEVWADSRVAAARAALFQSLRDEGYRKGLHRGDETIFRSYTPWEPRVIVNDDGWVNLKREPPRVHAPGEAFSDQGSRASYLLCIIAPTACVSVGVWLVSPRKLNAAKADVLDATRDEVRALNDAVARHYLQRRVNTDIPLDLEHVWAAELPIEDRRQLLLEYWDSRVDSPEGDLARMAVEAFMRGVVMQSDTPFTDAEIAAMNARRTCQRMLVLTGPVPQ